jgi:LemA protein
LRQKKVDDQAEAENILSGTLKTLFAVAESYPQLKADQNFRQLQEELTNTESKIGFSRQFYNDTVQKYNTKIQVFPKNIIAGIFGFSIMEYFNLDSDREARESIRVDFE